MFRIEIPVPQGQVTFQPRSLGEIGADILAFKIAIGLVLPPNTQRNIELLVSTQEALQSASYSPQVSQDKNSWFDCAEGVNIDIRRAASFDIRTKNAVSKFQLDNMFMIYYYYFETQIVKRILLGSAGANVEKSDDFEKYEKLIDFNYYEIAKLFDAEFGELGEATLAVMHGWRPGKVLSTRGYVHPETFDMREEVVSIVPAVFYEDFQLRPDFNYASLIQQGVLLSISPDTTKKMFYDFFETASSYRNWIKVQESSQNIQENASFEEGEIASFSQPIKLKTLIFPKEQDTTSVLYAFASFAATAIADLDSPTVSTLPPQETTRRSRENFREFFLPDPFSTTSPFEIDEDTLGFYYKTGFLLNPEGPFPDDTPEAIRQLEDRALQQVLDFYRKPKIWNFFLKGDEFEKVKEHYFAFSETIPAPQHAGGLPQGPLEEERLRSIREFIELKDKIKTEEDEIKRVEIELEPRIGHVYPPNGPWAEARAELGEVDPLPESVIIQRYRDSRNNLIDSKKNKIREFNQRIEEIKNPSKAEEYYVLATDSVLESLNTDEVYANSWRTIESGRVEPLIKFQEFITPTLRPGQAYRAYFKINKNKLNLITYGSSPMTSGQPSAQTWKIDSLEPCYYKTTEQEMRIYEEYQLHAQKRRRELTRKLRSGFEEGIFEESSGNIYSEQPDINLGPFGPFDLKSAFSSIEGFDNVRSDREYTRKALYTLKDKLVNLSDMIGISDTDFEDFNQLIEESESNLHGGSGQKKKNQSKARNQVQFTLKELKERIDKAGEDIQTSYEILLRENITLEPASAFDGPSEVATLNLFYTQLVNFLDQNVTSDFLQRSSEAMKMTDEDERFKNISDQDPGDIKIWLRFEPTAYNGLGPKNGKNLTSIVASIDTSILRDGPKSENLISSGNLDFFSALSRPRTVNYVSRLISMTSPFSTEEGSFFSSAGKIIGSYFDGILSFCSEMGLDGEKHAAISQIGTFTSGIKVRVPDSEGPLEGFVSWFDTYFAEPFVQWSSTSGKNFATGNPRINDEFDPSRALKMLGKTCTIEKIYEEFADRFDARMLICNYLECLKIPAFSLTLPSFTLPPFPRIPVIGIYWAMVMFLYKNFIQIMTRILCTMARTLIDKLAFPMCQEQLEDFMAAGSSALPALGRALASAFTKTGLYIDLEDPEEVEKVTEDAKQFFSDTSKVVTGTELCHLLEGRLLDSAAMTMLETLAQNNNLSQQLDSDEAIVNFFGVLGPYVPAQVCKQLAQVDTQLGAACDDENDSLKAIRNRLMNGEGLRQVDESGRTVSQPSLSPEQVKKVMDIAEKNLQKQKDVIRSLSDNTLMDLLPENLKPGSNHKIVSSIPSELKSSLELSVAGIFQSSRISYVTALASYIPSVMVSTYDAYKPGEVGYPDTSYLRLEACLERMRNFSLAVEKSKFIDPLDNGYSYPPYSQAQKIIGGYQDPNALENSRVRISPKEVACLYEVYETEKVKLPPGQRTSDGRDYHIVHKRFKPKKITGVFQTSYRPDGNWDKNKLLTVIDNFTRTDKEELGLKYYDPETFIKMVRPDPLDEDYEEITFSDEITLDEGKQLTEGSPAGNRARANGQQFRPYDRYYIATFDTSPDAPKTRLDAEFILRPIRVNCFANNRPFQFPLPPSGFGSIDSYVQNSIAYRDAYINRGANDNVAELVKQAINEKLGQNSESIQIENRRSVQFPSIRLSDKVVSSFGGSGYSFFDSLTNLDFESVPTSRYPNLAQLLDVYCDGEGTGIRYNDPDHQSMFIYPCLQPLSKWLPLSTSTFIVRSWSGESVEIDSPELNGPLQSSGFRCNETCGPVDADNDRRPEYNLAFNGRTAEENYEIILLEREPNLKDSCYLMIEGAYHKSDLNYDFQIPRITEQRGFPWPGEGFWANAREYKAPTTGNFQRKGMHTRSPFFHDDFFMSDQKFYFQDSEAALYSTFRGLADDDMASLGVENYYSDSLVNNSDNFLRQEIMEGLNSTLSKVMGANVSSKIIISSPLDIDRLSEENLIPDCIRDFKDDPKQYRGFDWPEKWGSLQRPSIVNNIYTNETNPATAIAVQGLRGPIRNEDGPYRFFRNCCPPYGEIMSWIGDYYHKEHAINNPKLLEQVQSRLNELSGVIIEELENIQNQASEKLMPMIKKVMKNTLNKNSSRLGNVNYTSVNPPGSAPSSDYRTLEPLDLLNISFRAGPHQPSLKLVEFATKNQSLDAYNVVIDQDRMLDQGPNPLLDRGSKFASTETAQSLNSVSTSTREIFKFCDTLPEEVIENNTEMFKMSGGEDFSRREAYSEVILSSLDKFFDNSEQQKQFSRAFLKPGLKSLVFKSSVETIVSNLLENVAHSSLFTNNYASRLGRSLSARPYQIPGTKCLRNRYGLTSSSLLNFEETLLKDAISTIEAELRKPEFSPFKRNFNAQGPIQSAIKKVAFKMFVKVCLLDLMFKNGLSSAVWGLEPIISEPVFQKYAIEHVAKELDKSTKLRDSWGEMIEDLVGITNKRSSLEKFVIEMLMEFPDLCRTVFNPGLGHLDFYNWQNYGRVVDFSEQTDLPVEQSIQSNNFYKNFGLFKRYPAAHSDDLQDVAYKDIFTNQHADFAEWNRRWIHGIPEEFPKQMKALKFVKLKGYRPGTSTSEFNSFNLNKTRPTTASPLDKEAINHTAVNEFILEDYVRVFGEILRPLSVPRPASAPDSAIGTIIGGEDPLFEMNSEEFSEELLRRQREERERELEMQQTEDRYYGQLSDPRGMNEHGVVMSKQEFYQMMQRLWRSLSERGEVDKFNDIISNSTFYQGTRLVQLFLKKVRANEKISGLPGLNGEAIVFEPELINIYTNEGPGTNLRDMQFESVADIYNRYDATERVIKHIIENPLIKSLSERERSFLYMANVDQSERIDPLGQRRVGDGLLMGVGIPVISHEKPIDLNSCSEEIFGNTDPHSPEYLNQKNTIERLDRMVSDLSETSEYKALMEHIFPLRRYMAISSMSTTAMMAGYSDLPSLFESTKSMLEQVISFSQLSPQQMVSSGPVNLILSSGVIDLADFANKNGPNVPADPDDPKCFEWPSLVEGFWDDFYEEMKRLMKYTPSIILRGLANALDPAYKEMRAHYLNCDLSDLTHFGVQYKPSVKSSTPVGMFYDEDKSAGNQEGKYTPLFPTAITDFVAGIIMLFDERDPSGLGKTVAKVLSYAITGPLPFIDLSTAFKVPCADINKAWREGEKYDLGAYGRYGHPITPLSGMALGTYQLPADIEKRDSNCPDEASGAPNREASENECDDVE